MKIDAGFTSDAPWQFLMALNRHYMFIPVFVGRERVPHPPPLRGFSLRPKDEALHDEVSKAYVARLRQLADEWIETGRTDGVEEPRRRKLTGELKRTLNEWAASNQPDICFTDSGEREVLMPACKMDFLAPLAAALNDAVRFFGRFLDSPYRTRLFKCQKCNDYYFTQREPRGPIKYGTYCPLHRNAASANRSNEGKRVPEHERKLELAAQWWHRWPKCMTNEGERAQWVAAKINQGLGRDCTEIKRNWVTRHRPAIEEKVERRNRAPREASQGNGIDKTEGGAILVKGS